MKKITNLPVKAVRCHAWKWIIYDLSTTPLGFVRRVKYPSDLRHLEDRWFATRIQEDCTVGLKIGGGFWDTRDEAIQVLLDEFGVRVPCKHGIESWGYDLCEHEVCKHTNLPGDCVDCRNEWVNESMSIYEGEM